MQSCPTFIAIAMLSAVVVFEWSAITIKLIHQDHKQDISKVHPSLNDISIVAKYVNGFDIHRVAIVNQICAKERLKVCALQKDLLLQQKKFSRNRF